MAAAAPGQPDRLRQEAGQFAFLAGHFFRRLFRNDVVDFEDQMKERLIASLAVLAIIVFWSSELLLFKYNFITDTNISWQEKTYIFGLVMIIFGIITLLEWDVLFPDRQDFLNLTPLPVRLRTIFFAKLASFVLFIGLFSVAMNAGASVLFSIYLTRYRAAGNLLFAGWHAISHLAAAFAACCFVFFACVFLQFLLMAVLPHRVFRKVSLFIRGALLGFFFFLLLAFLVKPAILDSSFRSMASLKAGGALYSWFPPFWFVGLYEKLLGTADPVFESWARTAILALLAALGAFAAASGLSYYRHVGKTLEAARGKVRLSGLRGAWDNLFGRVVLRAPEDRAVYGFFSRTIRSSPKQRIAMTSYLGIAAGVIMLYVTATRKGLQTLTPANVGLLAQPLILSFVVLVGLRTIVNIPASPGANWIFEVTETGRTMRYAAGTKKAVFFRWLLPLAGLVFAVHLAIWDFVPALEHALFGLAVAGLGLETLFYRFRKVPFACTHVPGKFKFQTWGVPLALFLLVFFSATTRIERALLEAPSHFVFFTAAAAGLWLAFRAGNKRFYRGAALVFEEEPEPAMVTFPEGP